MSWVQGKGQRDPVSSQFDNATADIAKTKREGVVIGKHKKLSPAAAKASDITNIVAKTHSWKEATVSSSARPVKMANQHQPSSTATKIQTGPGQILTQGAQSSKSLEPLDVNAQLEILKGKDTEDSAKYLQSLYDMSHADDKESKKFRELVNKLIDSYRDSNNPRAHLQKFSELTQAAIGIELDKVKGKDQSDIMRRGSLANDLYNKFILEVIDVKTLSSKFERHIPKELCELNPENVVVAPSKDSTSLKAKLLKKLSTKSKQNETIESQKKVMESQKKEIVTSAQVGIVRSARNILLEAKNYLNDYPGGLPPEFIQLHQFIESKYAEVLATDPKCKRSPEETKKLAKGYASNLLFLRVINPTLANLVATHKAPAETKNITYLSKVLQNAANAILLNERIMSYQKEPFLFDGSLFRFSQGIGAEGIDRILDLFTIASKTPD